MYEETYWIMGEQPILYNEGGGTEVRESSPVEEGMLERLISGELMTRREAIFSSAFSSVILQHFRDSSAK